MGFTRHPSMRPCIKTFKHAYSLRPVDQFRSGGKTALGFGPDWIRIMVSMATDAAP